MKSKSEILEQQENAQGNKITEYIGKDGYVWQMILNAMEEYAQQQVNVASTSQDKALNLAGVSGSSFELIELLLKNHLKEAGKLTRLELDEQSEHELGFEIGRTKLALKEFKNYR